VRNVAVLATRPGTGDYGLEGTSFFATKLTNTYIRTLLKQIKAFKATKKKNRQAVETYYWDGHGDYFEHVELSPLTVEDADDKELVFIDENTLALIKKSVAVMECEQIVVDENSVRWTALLKHTDIYIITEPLAEETLNNMLKGIEP